MIKVSDYIFDFMSDKGMDTIFLVSGGAAGHLLNSIANRDDFRYNLISTTGLLYENATHATPLNLLISNTENRGDNIIVMDLVGYN